MAGANPFANCVVFECKQSMQHLHSKPPVVAETSLGRTILVPWYEAVLFTYFIEDKLAMRMSTSQTIRYGLARPINLGAIPPGGVDIAITWAELVRRIKHFVLLGLEQFHVACRPLVIALERDIIRSVALIWSVRSHSSGKVDLTSS